MAEDLKVSVREEDGHTFSFCQDFPVFVLELPLHYERPSALFGDECDPPQSSALGAFLKLGLGQR